jgi:hypothetical protein
VSSLQVVTGTAGGADDAAPQQTTTVEVASQLPDVPGEKRERKEELKKLQEQIGKLNTIAVRSKKLLEERVEQINPHTIARVIDDFRDSIYTQLMTSFTDAQRSGPGITKADIIIGDNLRGASILYRNYRLGLRQMPALDPAEQLGIFRARFIPFAVIGGKLFSVFGGGDSADVTRAGMFEIGLGFGNVTIASDQLVPEEFSARRLGVAFTLSEDLFSDSARVRALAITYNFNAYGSIGIGANFPGKPVDGNAIESYFSFGINKKAFEGLLGLLQKLFQE